eukprot:UC4_evm1s147
MNGAPCRAFGENRMRWFEWLNIPLLFLDKLYELLEKLLKLSLPWVEHRVGLSRILDIVNKARKEDINGCKMNNLVEEMSRLAYKKFKLSTLAKRSRNFEGKWTFQELKTKKTKVLARFQSQESLQTLSDDFSLEGTDFDLDAMVMQKHKSSGFSSKIYLFSDVMLIAKRNAAGLNISNMGIGGCRHLVRYSDVEILANESSSDIIGIKIINDNTVLAKQKRRRGSATDMAVAKQSSACYVYRADSAVEKEVFVESFLRLQDQSSYLSLQPKPLLSAMKGTDL